MTYTANPATNMQPDTRAGPLTEADFAVYRAFCEDDIVRNDLHVIGQSWPQPAEAATEVGADQYAWLDDIANRALFAVGLIALGSVLSAIGYFAFRA